MQDLPGSALYDYYFHQRQGKLWVISRHGSREEMPAGVYFRQYEDMSKLEQTALRRCRGKVLDIGAGGGSHALVLQQKNIAVTAMDISAKAVEVMRHRGVTTAIQQDIFTFGGGRFDTLLLLMNGIGLAGTVSGLRLFLQHAKLLLEKEGQLLFDSSDVAYIYEGKPRPVQPYYGEIAYRYQYKKEKTPWFTWLYIDKKLLQHIAGEEGYTVKVLYEDEHGQYLVRLQQKT